MAEIQQISIETGGILTPKYEILAVASDCPPDFKVGDYVIHDSSIASEIETAQRETVVVCPHHHVVLYGTKEALLQALE